MKFCPRTFLTQPQCPYLQNEHRGFDPTENRGWETNSPNSYLLKTWAKGLSNQWLLLPSLFNCWIWSCIGTVGWHFLRTVEGNPTFCHLHPWTVRCIFPTTAQLLWNTHENHELQAGRRCSRWPCVKLIQLLQMSGGSESRRQAWAAKMMRALPCKCWGRMSPPKLQGFIPAAPHCD